MLIIFDCDGVLVDSEYLAAEIFSNCLNANNIQLSTDVCFEAFQGLTLQACYKKITEEFCVSLPKDFNCQIEEATRIGFDDKLEAIDGVEGILRRLRLKNIETCVASNGGHKKIEHALRLTGLLQYFPNRFSAEDVSEGKPKPFLFEYALREMKCNAQDAVVIEDSYTGYLAAQSAKIKTLIYSPHGAPKFDCEHSFSSMEQLPSILGLA